MAKLTLLNMVQNIMSSMDSDNVNSLSSTEEAMQVAEIIKETYYELISRHNWDFMNTMSNLESVSDITKPTKIKIPDNIQRVEWIKYKAIDSVDPNPKWRVLTYLPPFEFIAKVQGVIPNSNTDTTTNDSGVEMYVYNNKAPKYWTSFDDVYVYFDSYDSLVEASVQSSKTTIKAVRRPSWSTTDTFIPELPEEMFPLLLNESKSVAFLELKQQSHPKAEQKARRQFILMREQEPTVKDRRRYVDYSKRTTGRGRSNTRWEGTSTSS